MTVTQIRIIGGRWRGSKLDVTIQGQLRPSGDRVRETLFNWFGATLYGMHCLDVFAGTGALGLEAVSRGAASALLIEQHLPSAKSLQERVSTLQDSQTVEVLQGDAYRWLKQQALMAEADHYDVIFLDPPFTELHYEDLLDAVRPILRDGGRLYLETATSAAVKLPNWLQVLRQKTQGQVAMTLLQRVQ